VADDRLPLGRRRLRRARHSAGTSAAKDRSSPRPASSSGAGWSRRKETHPRVMAALAAGDLPSESYARAISRWT